MTPFRIPPRRVDEILVRARQNRGSPNPTNFNAARSSKEQKLLDEYSKMLDLCFVSTGGPAMLRPGIAWDEWVATETRIISNLFAAMIDIPVPDETTPVAAATEATRPKTLTEQQHEIFRRNRDLSRAARS